MNNYLEIISVPAIATIVYWVVNLIKLVVKSEKFNRFIPLLAAGLGAVFGVVAFLQHLILSPRRTFSWRLS